jgi:two-component system sensor histidine kinase CpxA
VRYALFPKGLFPKSLFTTIFLWFLLAVGAIFLVAVGSAYLINRTVIENQARDDLLLYTETYGTAAADLFEKQGFGGVRHFLHRTFRQDPRFMALLFDSTGKPLFEGTSFGMASHMLPLPPPHRIREALREEGEILFDDRSAMMARKVVSSGGRDYYFLGITRVRTLLDAGQSKNALFRTLLLLGGGLLFCYWLTRHLTRPIRELQRAALRLGSGDLTARAPLSVEKRHDEIGSLGHTFNAMALRLDHLLSNQRRLLRDISHELRSPLARLSVALEIGRKEASPEMTRILDRIEKESLRMDQMVGELLALSRMEAEAAEGFKEMFSLSEMLLNLEEDASFEAHGRGIRVNLQMPEKEFYLSGFPRLLASAVENVVRNALRHSPEGGEIFLELRREEKAYPGETPGAVILVQDQGAGVPEEELPRLFTPFYRVDSARTRESGGAGLGLAIAERAVHLHGGTITAWNETPSGLGVEIRLPLEGGRG